jgi:1,4-dihydroxy-2-naphthoate octaprenyltransferase
MILSPNDVARLGAIFYIFGCIGFLILTITTSARMEHLALVYFGGLSSSFLYTGGFGLKYIALGDILIIFTFGPLTVLFAYLSQCGHLSYVPMLFAIPKIHIIGKNIHFDMCIPITANKINGINNNAVNKKYDPVFPSKIAKVTIPAS